MDSNFAYNVAIQIAKLENFFDLKNLLIIQFREHRIELAEDQIGAAIDSFLDDDRW